MRIAADSGGRAWPPAPRTLGERHLLEEASPASDLVVEKYLAGVDPLLLAGCYHGSASWFECLMGGPAAAGTRLFIQSSAHLYCVGEGGG